MSHYTPLPHCWTPRATAFAVVATMLAGCNSRDEIEAVTSPTPNAAIFNLSTIDGSALPYTIPYCASRTVVTSATLDVRSDHSYSLSVRGSAGGRSIEISSDEGTWEAAGTSIQFSGSDFENVPPSRLDRGEITAILGGAGLTSSSSSFTLLFTTNTTPQRPKKGPHPL
jgi:hypothetical protein